MGSLATRGQCRGDVGRAGADAVARALVACLIAFSSLSATAAPGLASEPEPARIKGVVTSSDGVPLTDVTITVYHERGPDDYWYKGMFFTGSDGSYECTIDPGAHYPPFVLKLEDRTRRHASQMVGSPSIFTPEEATHFSPSPGETLDGVDIVLQEGGVIEGHVRSRDDGRPLFGRTVVAAQAWVETLDGGEWREPSNIGWRLWSGTDDDGAYAITGLESREYRLQFRDNWGTILPEDMKDAHQWIYFGNEADPARATPVSVDGTQTTSGVDIDPVQARARIFGTDRYQTALAASRHAFGAGEAKSVVVASGEDFPDALSASVLAGAVRGPILLTGRDTVPQGLAEEITRLGADTVYIVGGTRAISENVSGALDASPGVRVTRLQGSDRYATAARVAREAASLRPETAVSTAFIVRGDDFADAVTASAFAFSTGIPVLLTRTNDLPDATRSVLDELDIEEVIIVGGTRAVSARVDNDLGLAGMSGMRMDGVDRFWTSIRLAEHGIAEGWGVTKMVGLASGHGFADAVSAGPACGMAHGVLLLVRPEQYYVASLLAIEWGLDPYVRGDVVTVFGGARAVSQAFEAEVRRRLAPSSYE